MTFVQQSEKSLEEKRQHCMPPPFPSHSSHPFTTLKPLPTLSFPPLTNIPPSLDVKVVAAFESALALMSSD